MWDEILGEKDPFLIPTKLRLEQKDERIDFVPNDDIEDENGFELTEIPSGEELFKVAGEPIRINNKVQAGSPD